MRLRLSTTLPKIFHKTKYHTTTKVGNKVYQIGGTSPKKGLTKKYLALTVLPYYCKKEDWALHMLEATGMQPIIGSNMMSEVIDMIR